MSKDFLSNFRDFLSHTILYCLIFSFLSPNIRMRSVPSIFPYVQTLDVLFVSCFSCFPFIGEKEKEENLEKSCSIRTLNSPSPEGLICHTEAHPEDGLRSRSNIGRYIMYSKYYNVLVAHNSGSLSVTDARVHESANIRWEWTSSGNPEPYV